MKKLAMMFVPAIVACAMSVPAFAIDIDAGPIANDADAKVKCPKVCAGLKWNGQWTTTGPAMSVCGTTVGVDIPIGPIWGNDEARTKCLAQLPRVTWNGNWKTTVPGKMSVCGCNPPPLK